MTTELEIVRGPCPGFLGDVAAMHGRYYAEHWDFPVDFEAKVAREMGNFLVRYDPARDGVFRVGDASRILGSVTVDGSDPTLPSGQGHVRWFILDPGLVGRGLGRRLLEAAMAEARAKGLTSLYLTTFRGLDTAMALYRNVGFELVAEAEGRTWGRTVSEQRMEMQL